MSTTTVKTRKFIAAPKGKYPPPLRVQRHVTDPASSARVAQPATALPADDPQLPDATSPSTPAAPPLGLAVPDAGPALPEASAATVAPAAELEAAVAESAPQLSGGAVRSGVGWGRILIGGLAGTVFGLAAGSLLLALSGGAEAEGMKALYQPVTLWQSIDDPLVKASALLVAVGFVLLGAGLAGRRSGERSS